MRNNNESIELLLLNESAFDLIVYHCGMEKCKESHAYGPAVRDHFLIHFILDGHGTFYVDGKAYKLNKNQGFLICPDVITYYEADSEEPWTYAWVGFKGMRAESYMKLAHLDRDNPIFVYEQGNKIEKCFEDMINSADLKYGRELKLQGLLSIFLSELIEQEQKETIINYNYTDIYVKKALKYIETNFSRYITIAEVAETIGLNKNYFSSLFKDKLGISPQEHLIRFRVNKACELMKNKSLSISDVARSVGYNDPLAFSKIFKKVKGISPKMFRESMNKSIIEDFN